MLEASLSIGDLNKAANIEREPFIQKSLPKNNITDKRVDIQQFLKAIKLCYYWKKSFSLILRVQKSVEIH